MKTLFLFFFCLNIGCSSANKVTTTIILIRHAEKRHGQNPGLISKGRKRAESLVTHSQPYTVTGIYSTNYKRTIETAAPLAEILKLPINRSFHPTDYQSLFSDINQRHRGKAVLVVGHSNTVPGFINFLSPQQNMQPLSETDFSNLFLIKIIGDDIQVQKTVY